ncbi:MAG: tRNA (uridine(54)-C5)-methyltransferase TrmA [Cellvibrionaceae bacterium]
MIAVSPDPTTYEEQFLSKEERLTTLLAPFNAPGIESFRSPPLHYRLRAEFKIWHEGDSSHYAIFNNGRGKPPTYVESFPTASLSINKLMPILKSEFLSSELMRNRLFQIEFLSTLTGDMLVTMIYHKPLTEEWESAARILSDKLNVKIIGRSKKQKLVLQHDYVEEIFNIENQKTLTYRQLEGCFSQPNGNICQQMLNWAVSTTQKTSGDLLELYCGNGNFTVALAQNFNQVLATEISKPLTAAAILNCKNNGVQNVNLVRMSAEDISAALNGEREFRRLKEINLDDYNFSTVFVDPPRAGLDSETEKMIQQFDTILYISCNPETLVENLKTLTQTHSIERSAFFDQFPYTDHMECGVLLKKMTNNS